MFVKKCKNNSLKGDIEAKPFFLIDEKSRVEVTPDIFTSVSDLPKITVDSASLTKFVSKIAVSAYTISYLSEDDTITVGGFLSLKNGEFSIP